MVHDPEQEGASLVSSPLRTLSRFAAFALVFDLAATVVAEDFSRLAPEPAAEEQRLRSSKVSLLQAVEIAQKSVGGVAADAKMGGAGDNSVKVTLYANAKKFVVTVDAATGEVRETEEVEVSGLPGEPAKGELIETKSGLKYYDLVVGTGEQPPSRTTKVKVHYTGYLVNGKKFDSSVDRGQPIDFPLNRVISGWTEGVGSMKVGGKRKLLIPYSLAYGAAGRPGIPPKAMLIFDVELIAIVK
jgi:FKBP-type peptidyl-prolyl cis-trans isomerase